MSRERKKGCNKLQLLGDKQDLFIDYTVTNVCFYPIVLYCRFMSYFPSIYAMLYIDYFMCSCNQRLLYVCHDSDCDKLRTVKKACLL